MSNRFTKGLGRFGKVDVDAASGFSVAGTAITATPAELNRGTDLSVNLGVDYIKAIALTASSTVETAVGYSLSAKQILRSAEIYISAAASAGSAYYLGLDTTSGGTGIEFLNGVSTTGTGFSVGSVATTSGFLLSTTFGAGLANFVAGTTATISGFFIPKPYPADSATPRALTHRISSTGSTSFAGTLILRLTEKS